MLAARLILHGLDRVPYGGLVAALVTSNFLWSQGRYVLFARPEMELVLILSERPSVPPGEFLELYGEGERKGGSLDFAWLVFRRGGRRGIDVAARWVGPGKGNYHEHAKPPIGSRTVIAPARLRPRGRRHDEWRARRSAR